MDKILDRKITKLMFVLLFLISSIELAYFTYFLVNIPADPKNQWMFGFSFQRICLISFQFLILLLLLIFTVMLIFNAERLICFIEKNLVSSKKKYYTVLSIVFGFSIILMSIVLLPIYRFGMYIDIVERLLPIIQFVSMFCVQIFIVLLLIGRQLNFFSFKMSVKEKGLFKVFIIIFSLFTIFWIFLGFSRFGILNPKINWYEAGVPITSEQVWFISCTILFFYLLYIFVSNHFKIKVIGNKKLDISLGLIIFIFSAILWSREPVSPSFFAPGPYYPNMEYLPYSDAAAWDISAQFALMGQGIANNYVFIDHTGYSGFLALLHIFADQDFSKLICLQSIIFSIFPVIIYFLGKLIHNRITGLFLAGLIIFQELNAIAAGTMINLSHSKLLMTEFPTAILLAGLAYFLFYLYKDTNKNLYYSIPVGGILGLLILTRFNTLVIPFAIVGLSLLVFRKNLVYWIKSSVIIAFSLLLILFPRMINSQIVAGTPFFFMEKVILIFDKDFRSTSMQSFDSGVLYETSIIEASTSKFVEGNLKLNPITNSIPTDLVFTVFEHFSHNVIMSFLVLPTSFQFDDLQTLINEVSPFWDKIDGGWTGALNLEEKLFIFSNLILLAFGITVSWKKWKFAGISPLLIFFIYNFSNALGRTSGGRYVIPSVWVVITYFGIGLFGLIEFLVSYFDISFSDKGIQSEKKYFSLKSSLYWLFPMIIFVTGFTVLEKVSPKRYEIASQQEVIQMVSDQNLFSYLGISEDEFTIFAESPNARVHLGMALYPRFYFENQGEHSAGLDGYRVFNYRRLVITLVGPFGKQQAVLPFSESPESFDNGSDVIVIGCQHAPVSSLISGYIDAVAIIVLDEKPTVYLREPATTIKCPLEVPIFE